MADLVPSCSSFSQNVSAFSGVLMRPELGPADLLYSACQFLSSLLVGYRKSQTQTTANTVDIYKEALGGYELLNYTC